MIQEITPQLLSMALFLLMLVATAVTLPVPARSGRVNSSVATSISNSGPTLISGSAK